MSRTRYGFYLAVLPRYRTACMELLREQLGPDLCAWVSARHLDESVATDPEVKWYERVRMLRLAGGRAFIQVGHFGNALRVENLVVDLNPRSLTAWALLVGRFVLRRRTLVWGHIYPQTGPSGKTAVLRRFMRRLADGSITYTYSERERAESDLSGQPVWTAPNSLYGERDISPATSLLDRDSFLYVGRFAPAKKVALLVRAFSHLAERMPAVRLVLIGDGDQREELVQLVEELGLTGKVDFPGWIDGPRELRPYFERALAAVSPGYAGLSLTQSAGFGIPTLVSRDEPHSPEIELATWGAVRWFETDDAASLADAMERVALEPLPLTELSARISQCYSAEAMAAGLRAALTNDVGERHD